ncbi:alkene reductase [Cyclobacterium marinum]|uniref:NADH:flavin oxidoreductase/NADH oxidase n=1 Tax=Cyclobacterium marinum (strain ATCC 25205 / DSM 745 / LMG 13164 / NCIMB 1802) TaxID=880070 RepID=G0IWB5_CYCMS|nr:alkene reductase [Cyclobacterium marinum]AEL27103.1 NADH:flavin oxidoreductase/NADH oxidase [Cyclobacterium marinum DSM 745]MBR9777566.1 alkene reductase [Cytophagales bacterium]|tara:strand:- start:118716 stop:119807 length:1092 start_codon:yes stop_codon:yes gene_type:complete
MQKQPLLESLTIGDLTLANRLIMAPMTRSRADNQEKAPTDLHAEYYKQRASAGLIITEGSQISQEAVGYINTPGIHSKAQVEGWKKVTKAVHDEGGKIFIQLWHVGRISHPDFHEGKLPLAPSAINPKAKSFTPKGFKDTVTPKEMSIPEIKQTIEDFKNAASNAWEAGFDGVEIHSSNGYLLHQFFSRTSNVRLDEYGGSIANRSKILFEIIDAIKEVIPENRIGLRLNPSLNGIFGMTMDEESIPTFDYIIENLNKYNLAYLHLSEPFNDVSDIPYAETEIAKRYRPLFDGKLIINAGFDQQKGNNFILEGLADAVAYGKLFISNPDLPERFEKNAALADWDESTFYTPGEKGYTDYPKIN